MVCLHLKTSMLECEKLDHMHAKQYKLTQTLKRKLQPGELCGSAYG